MGRVTLTLAFAFGLALVGEACGGSERRTDVQAGAGSTDRAGSAGAGAGGGTSSGGTGGAVGGAASGRSNISFVELRLNVVEGCLPRPLPFGARGGLSEGRVDCVIAQVYFSGACACDGPGQTVLQAAVLPSVLAQAERSGYCGGSSGVACESACACQLDQLPGTSVDPRSELHACQNDVTPPGDLAGFCVIDSLYGDDVGPLPIGNPAIVADCPADEKRTIRFVGTGVPDRSAPAFLGCGSGVGAL